MKHIFSLLLCGSMLSCSGQQHQLIKLWETGNLAIPESVLPDFKEQVLYTSLIDGAGNAVDGKGGIAKLSPDGKIIDANWITGLNAPKGLGKFGNKLYVADLTEVVIIDIKKGKILSKIPISNSVFLNDITIDAKGRVYVSDTRTGKIHRLINDKVELWMENIPGVNGLKAIGEDLYMLSETRLLKTSKNKEITKIAEGFAKNGDGLEPLKNGDFIVSCWNGLIYYVYSDGKIELLLDTQDQKMNTADIGINAEENIIYVPTFNKSSIIAFQLK